MKSNVGEITSMVNSVMARPPTRLLHLHQPLRSQQGERLLRWSLCHACAIMDDGDLTCWGRNLRTIGRWWTTDRTSPTFSTALNLGTAENVIDVSSGTKHTCAILDNGDLKCWDTTNTDVGRWHKHRPTHLHPQPSLVLDERLSISALVNIVFAPFLTTMMSSVGAYE